MKRTAFNKGTDPIYHVHIFKNNGIINDIMPYLFVLKFAIISVLVIYQYMKNKFDLPQYCSEFCRH